MIFLSLFDYSVILNFYWMIYILNVILLALVIFMGDEGGGAQRWLDIGFRFQPSEIAKIFIMLFFAKFILKLARTMDLTINLRHIMNFGKAKFKAKILNDNSLVTNMDEFLRVAAKYV